MSLPKPKTFRSGLSIGTYGDDIIQTQQPERLARKINDFFLIHEHAKDMPLIGISEFVHAKEEMRLQVIHDPVLAESVRKDVMKNFK